MAFIIINNQNTTLSSLNTQNVVSINYMNNKDFGLLLMKGKGGVIVVILLVLCCLCILVGVAFKKIITKCLCPKPNEDDGY